MHHALRIQNPFEVVLLILASIGFSCVQSVCAAEATPVDYAKYIQQLESAVEHEVNRRNLSGVSVALVDDQRIVYANGFGYADKSRRRPARSDTVYRAGSISKLFAAMATMQLVEQGRLELDQPVTTYNPDFRIVIPFENVKPITLRQLLCHRSGMIREAPVGGYFDDSEPGTDNTVASLASCVLVHPPDSQTKYSNSGITIVGRVVSKVSKLPFEECVQQRLLHPIGMRNSAFLLRSELKGKLAKGYLPVAADGGGFHEIEAPQFEFGILPAGNLYTTVEDLAQFLRFLFAHGRREGSQLLRPETLEEMFTPQLTKSTNGFGLGFSVGSFRGHKAVSHMGAVYGFTSILTAIPQHRIGVVVLSNDDIAVGPVRKLNSLALSLILEAKLNEKPPTPPVKLPLKQKELAEFAGDYESESFWARLDASDGIVKANISNQRMTLTPVAPLRFQAEGRLVYDAPFVFERETAGRIDNFSALGQRFRRVDPRAATKIPEAWKKFLGHYGPGFIPLIISAKHGHLYAMTENEYDNRLTPLNQTVFKMPPGLYIDEQLVFQLDTRGKVHRAVLANMTLRRRR
ncbi:MAG: beta-lactamase family protein [Verrucomicrobia bacterium]|nr:beta-lactamase family protein [Verrucomicrobiota bacterium]